MCMYTVNVQPILVWSVASILRYSLHEMFEWCLWNFWKKLSSLLFQFDYYLSYFLPAQCVTSQMLLSFSMRNSRSNRTFRSKAKDKLSKVKFEDLSEQDEIEAKKSRTCAILWIFFVIHSFKARWGLVTE